jgi:hypothetical protein
MFFCENGQAANFRVSLSRAEGLSGK